MKSLSWKSFAGLLGLLIWNGAPNAVQAAGKIAFVSERDGNNEIYVMNSDGSGQTNLTNTPSRGEVDPTISPNGEVIVYSDQEDLWRMDKDGSNQARITSDGHRKLQTDFHPDGNQILFTALYDNNWDIFSIPLANGSSTRLVDNLGSDNESDWSPDGRRFIFKGDPVNEAEDEIYVRNADGSGQVRLTTTGGNADPRFSPDGTRILFGSTRDSGNSQIYVMNADGSNQTRLTSNGFVDIEPMWSPDGTQIAFVSNRDGDYEIYVMNADGSNLVQLTHNNVTDYRPIWFDDIPTIKVSDASISEGNSGTSNLKFNVNLSFAPQEPVSFTFSTTGGTAQAGSDYTSQNLGVTIPAGTTGTSVTVPILGDIILEEDETFSVRLSNIVGAVPAFQQPTANLPLNPENGHVYELVEAGGGLNFSEARDAAAARTYNGTSGHLVTITSQAEQDFVSTTFSDRTFWMGGIQPPGSPEPDGGFTWITGAPFAFTAWWSGEPNNVGDENAIQMNNFGRWNDSPDSSLAYYYLVEYDLPATSSLEATGTVLNDDVPPALSISSPTVNEGDSTNPSVSFTISLSSATTKPVTVHYATTDSSAKQGTDYTATQGDLTFEPGETQKAVAVPILDDLLDEEDETFKLNLSAPVNATLQNDDDTGTAKIIDNDPFPSVSIVPALTLYEGQAAETQPSFTITLSEASARTVIVKCYTTDIKAKAPSDYTKTTVTLIFAPGETVKVFQIPITNDAFNETSETFKVSVAAVSRATVGVKDSIATIIDDDGVPSFSINDVSVTESDADTIDATFTIQLSAPSSRATSVKYVTADGTALAGSDYTSTALRQLDFAPRETSKVVKIKVRRDFIDEPKEQFFLKLSAPVNATIRDGSGTGTIIDDDAAPSISINSPKISEGNGGIKNLTFTVKLVRLSTRAVTVNYKTTTLTTASSPATSGTDYEALPTGTLTFAPGQASKTISVKIKGDALDEEDETFAVVLSKPANATLGESVGTGTIIDDDAPPVASINDVTAVEGNGTYTSARFTVTLELSLIHI